MDNRHINIPIFVPHQGCSNECVFCNQRKISGENCIKVDSKHVENIIIENLKTISKNSKVEVAFFGGSFTGIAIEYQVELLNSVKKFIDSGDIDSIRLSTRPDYIDPKILSLLKKYNVKTIELGVQSMIQDVLDSCNRGHSVVDIYKASEMIKKEGFKLGIQTMIGLPNSTIENEIETARLVLNLLPDFVRIYPTLVIKDTNLEKLYRMGLYEELSLEKAVDICSKLLTIYVENNIDVIRLGLLSTEEISFKKSVIAGPFHPAFGQLVQSKIIYNKIVEKLKDIKVDCIELIIKVNEKDISNTIGQKKCNLNKLKKDFNLRNIKILKSNEIKRGNIELEYNKFLEK